MERHLYNKPSNIPVTDIHTPLSDIDKDRIAAVFRKYLPLIIVIFIVCNLTAYLKIRWTKPLYESYSDIKLDIKSEASLLGFNSINSQEIIQNNLEGEIELIRSKLFFNKVIDVLDLKTSYYNYGNVLNEERYKAAPFIVEYVIKDDNFYDKNFDIEIIDNASFILGYKNGDKEISEEHRFGETIKNKYFELKVFLKGRILDKELINLKYFFIANSSKKLVDYLEKNLTVEPWNYNANIIRIRFKDHNITKAVDLVNAIDSIYLKYTEEEKNKVNVQKINFLNEQLLNTENRLEEYEDYLENFTINNRTVDLNSDVGKTIVALESVDSARLDLAIKLQKVQDLQETVKTNQEIIFSPSYLSILPSEEFKETFQNYNTLIKKRILLSNSYSAETAVIAKLSEEIGLLKEEIDFTLKELAFNIKEEQAKLVKRRLKTEEQFVSLPSKGTDINKVRRYYALYEQFYLSMMQKKAEFEIAQAGTATDFKVLSSASYNYDPISPKKLVIHAFGFAISIFLIMGIMAIGYILHNKVTNQNEVESLSHSPILGVIPFTKMETDFTSLVVDKRPKSALSESLRAIRTNLDFLMPTHDPKIVTVTSTVSGEGKTFISVNLGAVLSISKNRVIILDIDMRRPKVHKAFLQTPSDGGLSTILIGRHKWQDCVFESGLEGLHFIQAGPIPPNPTELLLTDNFDTLLTELKEHYNYIILDTPPVGVVTDGLISMKKSDIQLYVVRADYSKRSYLGNVEKLKRSNNFQNIGIILNSLKINKNGYGYGYGDGSGYYEESGEKQNWKSMFKNLLRR